MTKKSTPFIVGLVFVFIVYVVLGLIAVFQLCFNSDYTKNPVQVIMVISFISSIVFRFQDIKLLFLRILILSDIALTFCGLNGIAYVDFNLNRGSGFILLILAIFALDWRNRFLILGTS